MLAGNSFLNFEPFCYQYLKCDIEKRTYTNKGCNLLDFCILTVMLLIPFNKLPWFDLYFFAAKNKKVEQCLMVGIGLDFSLFKNASKCELFIWHNAKLGEIISMHCSILMQKHVYETFLIFMCILFFQEFCR